jgi:flagellar biosynthesis protein FlhB
MAEDQDKSQKTEDATPKRLDEAHKKGQVAKSQELNHFFILSAVTALILIFGSGVLSGLGQILLPFLESPHAIPTDVGHLRDMSAKIGVKLIILLAPPISLIVVAAFAANILQQGFVFSWEQTKPKFTKISPLSGVKKMFSPRSLVELTKSVLKFAILGGVILTLILPEQAILSQLMTVEPRELFHIIRTEAVSMLVPVVVIMLFVGLADFWYQKYEHKKGLKMSKQDIKDENKNTEGDPQIKARIRALRAERARQRMMAAVPRADVIITNPTHYAVALQYEAASMAAPKLVAKGIDDVALRIRETAEEHDIPIVENPPLARAIYATVEIDQEVQADHYKAVAEVIGYVMKIKGDATRRKFTEEVGAEAMGA